MVEEISKSADVAKPLEKTEAENYKKIKPEGNISVEESKSFWNDFFKREKTDSEVGEQKNLSFEAKTESMQDTASDQIEKKLLGDEKKIKIKEETGWSDEIINTISSWKEYEVYKNAGAIEAEIDGKKRLIRNDIDWEQKDAMGRTNQIEKKPLENEEKIKIKEETGWSDEIINAISSWKEYEIYKNAGLVEAEIGGKKCLIRNDIDWEQKDAMGRTNKERAEQGLSPINKDGEVIELHHIGQEENGTLAVLTQEEHDNIALHGFKSISEIDRSEFAKQRKELWKSIAKMFENGEL